MAYDERLAERIRQAFRGRRDVAERKMFGGIAFMYRDRMCCGIVGRDLMVRVPAEEFDGVLRRPHVRPMDFTGRPLRGFVFVSPPGFRTAATLRAWLALGERVAEQNVATRRPVVKTDRRRPGPERPRRARHIAR